MSRSCGLEAYKGIKLNTPIRINFGKKVITECPNSYAKWEYVGDAMEAWQYYKMDTCLRFMIKEQRSLYQY